MKNIFILLQVLLIISCGVSKRNNTSNSEISSIKMEPSGNAPTQASWDYYLKYFDDMVKYSIDNGFSYRDQFGSATSYMIIKSTHSLALNGDTTAKMKLLDFVRTLAESKRAYKVDESISVLLDFSIDFFEKNDFISAIEFLNPKHLNNIDVLGSDTGSGDYTSTVFSKLLRVMTREDRDFYYGRFNALFSKALQGNQDLAAITVWNEFYPYLKNELNSNRIDFVVK